MATSHTVDYTVNHVAPSAATRNSASTARRPARNRFITLLRTLADALREARELEIRMLGNDRYRRMGEA